MNDLLYHGIGKKKLSENTEFIGEFILLPDNDNIVKLIVKNRCKIHWGDGTSSRVRDGSIISHQYDFNSVENEIKDHCKIVKITIIPNQGYHLTDINLDPDSENVSLLMWKKINIYSSQLKSFILNNSSDKKRLPYLKTFNIRGNR